MDEHNRGWIERWAEDHAPWHVDEVHPVLREYHDPAWNRVLVPLCGASLDLAWLADAGHEVVGVELSPIAARRVFADASLTPERRSHDAFEILQAGSLTVCVGDMLEMTGDVAGTFDAVWDRAALVAIQPRDRAAYCEVLSDLAPGAELLLATLDYDPELVEGPPFCITEAQVTAWFDDVERLDEEFLDEFAAERDLNPSAVVRRVHRARIPSETSG